MKLSYLFAPRFLVYLALLVVVFTVGAAWHKRLGRPFKILLAIVGLTVLSEITSRLLVASIKTSNPAYHVYLPLLYALHGCLYAGIFAGHILRRIVLYSILFFILLSLGNSLFFQPARVFPSNALLACCALLVAWGLLYFRQMLHNPVEEPLFRQGLFWYNISVVFFYTTTFLIWSFFNYFIRHKLNTKLLADLIYGASFLYYLLTGLSFYLEKNRNLTIANESQHHQR